MNKQNNTCNQCCCLNFSLINFTLLGPGNISELSYLRISVCYREGIAGMPKLGKIKKISVFWVMGLKILHRVGTHISGKNIILCILKGYFFPESLKKVLGFTSKFR